MALIILIGAICVGSTRGQTPSSPPQIPINAPYVTTTPEVVARMLKLAGVAKNDVVYDLGAGDGRIVITAAQKLGARGVGIEMDQERVSTAQQNARKAGVSRLVAFRHENFFESDIHEATVVTLYLLPEANLAVRPKLLRELKPGTRIVSNCFDMGDWKPEKEIEAGSCKIYLWRVHAGGATGT